MPRSANNLPGTLRRSSARAQHLYSTVLDNAEKQYGSGERASRTAMAALKHNFEKTGDHWQAKAKPGPSDPRSRQRSTAAKREEKGATYGGVDGIGNSRRTLYARARELDIPGRSSMDKAQLAKAIAGKQKIKSTRKGST